MYILLLNRNTPLLIINSKRKTSNRIGQTSHSGSAVKFLLENLEHHVPL